MIDSPLSREAEHRMASKGNADGSRLAHRKVIRRLQEEERSVLHAPFSHFVDSVVSSLTSWK